MFYSYAQSYTQKQYADYNHSNRTSENTYKNAQKNSKVANILLPKAAIDSDLCSSVVENAVNATEKFGKVLLHMLGEKNNKIIKSHSINIINKAIPVGDFLSDEDVNFLDSFSDESNDCKNSHTGLSYGDVQVTYDDAKEAVRIMDKAEQQVNKVRTQIFYDSINI